MDEPVTLELDVQPDTLNIELTGEQAAMLSYIYYKIQKIEKQVGYLFDRATVDIRGLKL